MKSLSLVMPIYNSAKFLDESITTILNTETDHFELILVNDGSTDSSALICEKYRKIDNRVRYVEQKNGGVSAARNTGLKNALGEYVWFIDSDDLVVNTEIIDIIRLLGNGGDIIYAKHANIGDEVTRMDFVYDNAELQNKLCDEMTNYLFGILKIGWEVWDKIYRRDFLFDNNIYFDRRWIQYEDGDFNLVASSLAKKCVGYNREIYLHRKDNFESLMHKKYTYDQFLCARHFILKWITYYQYRINTCPSCNGIIGRLVYNYNKIAKNALKLEGINRRKAINIVKQDRILEYYANV